MNQRADCRYSFKIRIREVLKGSAPSETLKFEYRYWVGCPGVDTFNVGDERYWLLDSAGGPDGKLHGNSCSFGSISLDDANKVIELNSHLGR